MKRRRTKKQHSSGTSAWVVRLIVVVIIGLAGWWGITAFGAVKAKIAPMSHQVHPFMVSQTDSPVILVVQQASPQQLKSISVARIDHRRHTLSVLKLPANLSDGQTTAAEYLAAGFDQELQQLVEQTIALPINAYLIQTAPSTTQTDWADLIAHHPAPGWWQTTIGAPWWLANQPSVQTNLTPRQLMSTLWLVRDTASSQVNVQTVPDSSFSHGQLVSDTAQIDQLVDQTLVDQQAVAQGTSVVVKNGTDINGLASLIARYAHHLGAEVVAVEAADASQTTTTLTAQQGSLFSQSIVQLLGTPLTIAPRTGRERADVELTVGTDALKRIGKPISLATGSE
jgi:hypothetical protein